MRSGPLSRTTAHPQRDRSVPAVTSPVSRRSPRTGVATGLATAFLAGDWTEVDLAGRAGVALGRRYRWLGPLAAEVVLAYHRPPLDRPRELAEWVDANDTFRRAWSRARRNSKPRVRRWLHPHFAAHLAGRVGWAANLNPARGRKLLPLLAAATTPTGTDH